MYGFEEIAQWHAESNSSVTVKLKRWKSSGSIYFVFTQYRIVSPYHCDTGIEVVNEGSSDVLLFDLILQVDCNDNTAFYGALWSSNGPYQTSKGY